MLDKVSTSLNTHELVTSSAERFTGSAQRRNGRCYGNHPDFPMFHGKLSKTGPCPSIG
jgi:hypothetical protein